MIDLRQIPLTCLLLLEQIANNAVVVWYMLLFVLVPQHNSMEVEHREFETLNAVQAAEILDKPHKVAIENNR